MRRAEASSPMQPRSPASTASTSPVASPRARRPMTTTTEELLYAQPASVHFGGFELERPAQQRVRVHNNSAKAVRLRYTFPTGKKGFRATFASAERPSFVSAGLSEEILVSFSPPAGFQYYYDCIQVRCEEVAYGSSTDVARSGATLIPLHAYPMVNEVAFPSRMDFGVVPRGTCARKCVDITCSVPVEFEYELRVTKPHPAFTVFPLTGTIPPRGEARIELEFRPLLYATASAELELHVSQLGFAPRLCTLAGSSSSTAVDTGSVVAVAEQKAGSPAPPSSESKPRRGSGEQAKASKATTPRNGAKSRDRKYLQESQFDDDTGEEEELEKVRGIEIPHALNSVTGVTFVLNQEPGKLKPKDLKKAIAANRALRQQQREEQAKLSTGNDVGGEAEPEEKMDGSSDNIYEEGELVGREKGVYSFERYRHLIRQERGYNSHRQDRLERLPKLLEVVSAQMDHPDYELALRKRAAAFTF
ncbi:Primary ciliary dyskinesia protein 1 [Phytophthora cinnamomi]|uniref:Primary ciliary dyskinesia protein 1 n=1 Tax=Phytophthora cinnamomi TaxID=4785 RepID=UPI003559B752|nr:Primary ciliary dyskinesia protein 1 [Phytophthora cinnamomi]